MRTILDCFKWILLPAFALVLTSCATVPAPETPKNETLTWNTRTQTLSNINSWDIKALIAIHTSKEAESATLRWQQNKQNYTIYLFGPLGSNSYTLNGTPSKVELTSPKGKKFTADSAESLLAQQTGWRLPVTNLKYWVRGLPVPGTAATKHFDTYHHLTELNQDGWHVQFLRYTSMHGIDLPSKIFLNNTDLSVKIIINQWQPLQARSQNSAEQKHD
ncbi:MAG: lipoprotein insertase outer membrane protein LolB [Gammaproteobacteria bacterium]|nr:lipoprotein insertase outer membrane protein LolB [Gammaproteobacteria bacterium]